MVKKSTKPKTFGSYIRELRTSKGIGQRELAKKIGVAPSYLNDIEKSKRTAPKINIIKKLSTTLKADLNLMYPTVVVIAISLLLSPYSDFQSQPLVHYLRESAS